MCSFDVLEIIASKRDGGRLDAGQIRAMVSGAIDGAIPDYQLTALLMAIYLNGLSVEETVELTRAIAASGEILDFSDLGPVVDKHSTGGVGDTVSFIAAPLAAACGVIVPMISGRALGHTGGTLDKLDSVPGLATALDPPTFRRAVEAAGVAIVEAGPALAPGDAVLYRLRDASATVAERGLIIASIFGKKLCVTPRGLVMDLKVGSGSFLADRQAARGLADRMAEVAPALSLRASYLLSDMAVPLGPAVGNAPEIEAAVEVLGGGRGTRNRVTTGVHPDGGLGRLRSLSVSIAGEMIQLAGLAASRDDGAALAERALAGGEGLAVFGRLIEAQGGDAGVVDDLGRLPAPRERGTLRAGRSGAITAIDARAVGNAAARLGTGRGQLGARIDPAAGLWLAVKVGDSVTTGDTLAELRAADTSRLAAGTRLLESAIRIGDEGTGPLPVDPVLEAIEAPPAD
jgi:pyrimidine-nucleoside phosphorylase